MRHRIPLPARLGAQFTIRDAASHGVKRGRADAADLDRPFHGVRSVSTPATFRATVDCYVPRLRPGQRFVGRTAVRIWDLPYPEMWKRGEELEVASPHAQSPPRTRQVAGRRLASGRARTMRVRGAPVVDPVAAVFSCASGLTEHQIVILLDALLARSSLYPGARTTPRPIITRAEIEARLAAWGRFPGCAKVRTALQAAREDVESPKETATRLTITEAGLPEPEVQYEVRSGMRFLARLDLAYPAWKIAIEYEGDGHRTDKAQWRRDIARQRDLEEHGWLVIRLTEADLEDPKPFLSRLRRAVRARAEVSR